MGIELSIQRIVSSIAKLTYLKGRPMKKLTKDQKSFKVNLVTEEDEIFVGFDVHKKTYAAAIWCNGLIVRVTTMPADNGKVVNFLEPMRLAIKKVVYEAGPTGIRLRGCWNRQVTIKDPYGECGQIGQA